MTTEQNKAAARRVYEAFNQAISSGNMSLLDEVLAADGIDHNPAPGQAPGLAGVKQTFAQFRTAFPDLRLTVEDQTAEGDKVASRIVGRGTHKGAFQGIPPTGKQVKQEGIDIVRIAGEKVVERWGI